MSYNPLLGAPPTYAAPQLVPATSDAPGHPMAAGTAGVDQGPARNVAALVIAAAALVVVLHFTGFKTAINVSAG